jgi:predicted Ser/Thr protein kinase
VVDALLSIVDAVPRAAPAEHLRLLERIGGGAFADVWHGRDNRLDRDVAFKLIRASREIEASVENHARALAKVNHPNVVTVHGVENVIVPDTGLVMRAIVMEFLDGQSLQARIDAGPAFTRAEAKAICTAIIEGVQAIHDVGLAHNDLHPGNIVVARAQTKVIDVLHRDASSLLTTGTMAHRFRTDCRAVRDLVRIVVEHSEMPPQVLAPLDSLGWEASLDAVRAAFGVVFAEAAPAPVTNEGGLPDFRVRVTVAVVGLDTGPAKQLSIEGQNFDSSAVFVSAAGFELADGRRLALTRDAATRAPLVGREVKPGDSMTVMFDPGAVIDELELDQVGAAFFRDKLGRVFRSTADAVQAALSPWRT